MYTHNISISLSLSLTKGDVVPSAARQVEFEGLVPESLQSGRSPHRGRHGLGRLETLCRGGAG